MTVISPFPSFKRSAVEPDPPDFDPTDGSWYWVTTDTYGGPGGADADGQDDRSAIQAVINAAASASKGVYVPAGTYRINPSGGYGLSIPSNITIRGAGATSVLELYDDGTDDRNYLLALPNRSNVTVKNLKLTGTQTDKEASVQLIGLGMSGAGCHTITVDGVTFDKGEYAVRCVYDSGTVSSGLTVTGCTTLSNVLNPFYLAYIDTVDIENGTFAANSVNCMPDRYPHHFYINSDTTNLTVSNCTLSGGQHWSIDVHTDVNPIYGPILFEDIVMEDVYCGCVVAQMAGPFTLNGLTATTLSTRYEGGQAWFKLMSGTTGATFKNFSIAARSGNSNALVETWEPGDSNLLQDGSITDAAYYANTPRGWTGSGDKPTYDNVTVNGTVVNYEGA